MASDKDEIKIHYICFLQKQILMIGLSLVIPVYNEEENITKLHHEIVETCRGKYNFEIIIVDDGSSDRTAEIAKGLSPVKFIQFRKNFGQTAAFDAGIKAAKYDLIVTMDGDGQNDPGDIPKMLEYLERNDLDIVSGWRKNRKDKLMKRFVSRVANRLRKVMVHDGIHDSGCSLKVYKKECFDNITLYGEMHRFIPAMLKIKGFSVGEVVVNHRNRQGGITKYNWRRTFKGFIDMLSVWFWNKYAVRPLHLLGVLGLLFLIAGFVSTLATLYIYFIRIDLSNTVWPLLTVFLIITGILLLVLGLISDMLSKSYYETTKDSSYSVKEVVENE